MKSSKDDVNFVFCIKKLNFFGGSKDKTLFNNWFKFSGVDIKGNWKTLFSSLYSSPGKSVSNFNSNSFFIFFKNEIIILIFFG